MISETAQQAVTLVLGDVPEAPTACAIVIIEGHGGPGRASTSPLTPSHTPHRIQQEFSHSRAAKSRRASLNLETEGLTKKAVVILECGWLFTLTPHHDPFGPVMSAQNFRSSLGCWQMLFPSSSSTTLASPLCLASGSNLFMDLVPSGCVLRPSLIFLSGKRNTVSLVSTQQVQLC